MCSMDEKKLKQDFMESENVKKFGSLIGTGPLRIYAFEFPTRCKDKTFYADIVLENDTESSPMFNDLYILEFKDHEIVHSALDQLNLYCDTIPKQLYRRGKVMGVLVSSVGFSNWEMGQAKKEGRLCVLFDGQNISLA